MIFLSDIPHLKVYKQKTMLPIDRKIQTMYSVAFINNRDAQSTIATLNNQSISSNAKFHNYFIESSYHGTLFGRTYREIRLKEREELYKQINKDVRFIQTPNSFSQLTDRNVYYDLQYYNDIFLKYSKRTSQYKVRVDGYINYLKSIFNDPKFENYVIKTVITDVECWVDDFKDKIKGSKMFNNPIFFVYYAMLKMLDKFKELGDINLVFYSGNTVFRVNPSLCDKNSYRVFRTEIAKLNPTASQFGNDEDIDKQSEDAELYTKVVQSFTTNFNFTGDSDEDSEVEDAVKERIGELMENEDVKDLKGDELEKKLTTAVINDEEILKKVYTLTQENKVGRSQASLKREQVLREKQKEIKLKGMTLDQIRRSIDNNNIVIESDDVAHKIVTTNKNVTKVKYPHFEKAYNDKLMQKDLVNTVTFLNEKSIPVYIRNVSVVDTSDELNYKETYTFELEDANHVRHKLKFDMPKFIDDKFMYLNGNKKIIIKQQFMKPVVKTGPDEVQVCSNYNKIFIRRYGNKVSSKIEKIKKAISDANSGIVVRTGNNLTANNKYLTTIEYDELAKNYTYIKIKNSEFYFNQDEVHSLLDKNKKTLKSNELCIGFTSGREPIIVNLDTQRVGEDMDIVDFMLSCMDGKLVQSFDDASAGKKFMYSRATIMARQVPLVLLLGYLEGITTVMRKANIKHTFSDTRPKPTVDQGAVQFANGYLVYDKYPFENSLLMNAFADIPTKGFNYEDFDGKDAYLNIFDALFSTKIIGNAFDNFYEFMIDPITREVLEDLDYPTDFVSLMLFANALLADNSQIRENNMNLYRVRSNELVNAYLYKAVSDAYIQYRMTANNNNPVKISVPQDVVLKKILMAQTVEDYSILNPIVELEKSRAITPKGHVGMNLDDAYTQDKRSYDKTMMGILAMSTSPDANCGIVRQLTLEPNIISPRGYIDVKDDKIDELTDAQLFSPAELLSPLGVTRDDSIRTAMATKQSKHIIPIEKSSPVLISNGVEQVIHYHLGNDFSVVAKDDGECVEVDDKTGIVVVKYKNGQVQAIDTTPRVVKNGAGGFFLSNTLQCDLKKGSKFKKHDVIAHDPKFFTNSDLDGNRFNIGSLQKVACMSSYSTYEDSTFITKKLSEDMAADIIMQKAVTLGKNSNVDYIVNVGDKVTVGDELLRFETSFDDSSLNKFLDTVGDSLKEDIKSLGKTPIKSKYSGVIEDIKIYSTVDLDDLSPSLRKIVNAYYNKINTKKKLLGKYDATEGPYKAGMFVNEPTTKVETKDGKVKGNEVGEGVLIEFYIKYRDVQGIGDKLTFFTALKSIIGDVTPEGYEPYSAYRPEEEVSSFIAPGAVLARMTPSILQTMFGNKVLVELKRQLEEIYTGKPWEPHK